MNNTTISTTVSSSLTTLLNSTITTLTTTTTSPNQTTNYENCLLKYSRSTCRFAEFIRVLAYLFLAASLVPQILYLVNHGSRYIAGISYMWIIVRVLALASLMVAHAFNWSSIFELIALISTLAIFIQIFIYADNLHRQQKVVLLGASVVTWLIGGGFILLYKNRPSVLITLGYLLLSSHVLPQILLNSFIRTAKALSKFSILFLGMSDTLLFAYFYTINERYLYLITTYYSITYFLFIYIQTLVYTDSHINLIYRSAHTVLARGVDIFSGIDSNSMRNSGQDPQMFSIDDPEQGDGTDVIYQPVTSNKSSQALKDQPPMNIFVWYATLAAIVGIQVVLTIMIVLRAWSPWIILVPISIPAILGIFYLLRVRLSDVHSETLRKIL